MSADTFEIGDLVWAKMKTYPEWPGKIINHPGNKKRKGYKCVFFFGTKNHAWIRVKLIKHHSEAHFKNLSKQKLSSYQVAVEEMKEEILKKVKVPTKKNDNGKDNSLLSRKLKPDTVEISSKKCKFSKEISHKILKTATPKKFSKKSKILPNVMNLDTEENLSMEAFGNKSLFDILLPSIGQVKDIKSEASKLPLNDISLNVLQGKKIGFIELSEMGRALVHNLYEAGHTLTLFNREVSKFCKRGEFKEVKPLSVAEIVSQCDIIFCCASDPDTVQDIIFGEDGILKGMEDYKGKNKKGYVEMTPLDHHTSQKNGCAIRKTGMRYLEAPVIGSPEKAIDGSLIILASGDRDLFNDCCEQFLFSWANMSYFLSCDLGISLKMNNIYNAYCGIMQTALSEMLVLANSFDLSKQTFLDILKMQGIINESLHEKGLQTCFKIIPSTTYLKHQQRNLRLSLNLGEEKDLPMPMTRAAHEKFFQKLGK